MNTPLNTAKWTLRQISQLDPQNSSAGTAIFMAKTTLEMLANKPDSAAQGAMGNEKISLWFFRDLTNEQRIKLFGVFGFDSNELATANHGLQRKLLKSILGAQPADATAQPVDLTDAQMLASFNSAENVIDGLHEVRNLLANTAQGKPEQIDSDEPDELQVLLDEFYKESYMFGETTDQHHYRAVQLIRAAIENLCEPALAAKKG